MDSPPTPRTPRTRHRIRTGIIGFGVFLVLLFVLVLVFSFDAVNSKMVWLTPAELARVNKDGPITKFRHKLQNLTEPIWRHFVRNRSRVFIEVNIFSLSTDATQRAGLGNPASVNTTGMRSWILSTENLKVFRQNLETLAGVTLLSSPRVLTADNIQSEMSMGQSMPSPKGAVFVGSRISLTPKVQPKSINLLIAVTATEPTGVPLVIRTNLDAACRTAIPRGGALVIAGGLHSASNTWLIVSPDVVDESGKPIKP